MTLWRLAFSLAAGVAIVAVQPASADFDEGAAAMRVGQYAVAFDAWQKSAAAGDARSQYGIGYLYQFGLGVSADQAEAKAWYQKSAAQNDPDALFALGLMYESGRAGPRDRAEAIKLYERAAATGKSVEAEYALGRIYMRGQDVPRDESRAMTWITKAANAGHPGAQYLLGEAYEVGDTVKASKVDAYYWYTAALNGDEVLLRQADPEFDPKTALEVLTKHMSWQELDAAKAKLKKSPPPEIPVAQPAANPKTPAAPGSSAPPAGKPAATGSSKG